MPADPGRIEACARSPFKNVRLYALERIVADGHPLASELLLPLLSDPVPEVQLEAAKAAGILGCQEAMPALLELLSSASEPVAVQAAVSLEELGHQGDLELVEDETAPPSEPPPAPQVPAAAAPAKGGRARRASASGSARPDDTISDLTFYLLFAILTLGLFASGYLFRAGMEPAGPASTSSGPGSESLR